MIPGPGPGTNLSLSSLPSQPARCRLRHDFNVNDTKLPQHSSRHPASASYLAGVMKACSSSYRFSSVTRVCFQLRSEQNLLTPLCAAQTTVNDSPRSRPDQAVQARSGKMIITEPLHGDINGRNMTTPGVIREILSVPSWYRVQAAQAVCYT